MAKVGGDDGCLTPSVEPELSQPGKTVEAIERVLFKSDQFQKRLSSKASFLLSIQ